MKTVVMCVCDGNTCRSPMASILLQKLLGEGFLVGSAGLDEVGGKPANPFAVEIMAERGLDLSQHRSMSVWEKKLPDIFVCVSSRVADILGQYSEAEFGVSLDALPPILILNESGGGIPDPYREGERAYRECVALIERELPKIAEQIRAL